MAPKRGKPFVVLKICLDLDNYRKWQEMRTRTYLDQSIFIPLGLG